MTFLVAEWDMDGLSQLRDVGCVTDNDRVCREGDWVGCVRDARETDTDDVGLLVVAVGLVDTVARVVLNDGVSLREGKRLVDRDGRDDAVRVQKAVLVRDTPDRVPLG